jgi:hypothetical protein
MPQSKRLGCSEAHELNKSKNSLFTHLLKTLLVLWLKIAGRFDADPIAAKLKTDSVTCDKA